jgi:hypothetical protein
MLVVLEGPDRAGKTTLFEALRRAYPGLAVYVPNTPFDEREIPVLDLIKRRSLDLWKALYDPEKLYVCDRSPFTSNVVYAEVYGRPAEYYPEWDTQIRVLYLEADEALLQSRPKDSIPQDYSKVLQAYAKLLPRWPYWKVRASLPPVEMLRIAADFVKAARNSMEMRP